ncbi:hypothetical protein GCM10025857_25060 [Alicyclobacillus contaminans]|uniref:DUF2922 domain-containing protein n=1 Tax=Alicyclobacillus contaminans TaxID=392016 RepID=UPI000420A48D|nr:DUF2922 domain-containing protein [Alicyclobacillus contaminans]GMA51149.1 hypothetical protein GCM10025857_25060 [Alicyclobacillus contaminans]
MATKTTLQMTFMTDQDKKVRINIPGPKAGLDANAVGQVMDLIVSKGIFAFPQGKIVKKVDAVQVSTDSTTLL